MFGRDYNLLFPDRFRYLVRISEAKQARQKTTTVEYCFTKISTTNDDHVWKSRPSSRK